MAEPAPGAGSGGASSTHYLELDGIRGVLACGVMVFHLGINTMVAALTKGHITDSQWPLCVDYFFTLSGFVLCRSFLRTRPTISQFLIKRVFRLAPVFFLSTLAVLILTGLSQWSAVEIVTNLLMVQSLVFQRSINFVSWSIPFEFVLPIVGLVGAPWLKKCSTPIVVGVAIVAAIAQMIAVHRFAHGDDIPYLRSASGLAAGAAYYLIYERLPRFERFDAAKLLIPAFAAGLAIIFLAGVLPNLTVLFPLAVAATILSGAPASGLFSTLPLRLLGQWSYSIYLLHIPVLLLTQKLLGQELSAAVKLALVAGTLALSGLVFRFVEQPFISLGSRVGARFRTVSPQSGRSPAA